MKYFFWFCLILIIPGLLIRIPFGGAGILLTDIFLPLFAIIWLGKKLILQEEFPQNKFILSGLIFLAVAAFSWILGAWELDIKAKILSFSYIIRFFSVLVFSWAAGEQLGINSFLKNIYWILGVILFFGFLQFYLLPDIGEFSTEGGFDPHTGRFLGTWMDPNYLGGFLSFMIPLMLSSFYLLKNNKYRIIFGSFLLLTLWALFLTFSRSAYLATAVGMFIFFLFKDRKMIFIGIVIISLGILSSQRATKRVGELVGTMKSVILMDTDEIDATASLRIENWQKSFELWQKYPSFGIGYNTYRFRAAEEGVVDESFFSAGGADSTLLTILVTTGIFGFLSFSYFCTKILFINLRKYLRHKTKNKIYYLAFLSGFSAIIVHSLFVNSLLFPLIFLPVMAVGGRLEGSYSKKIAP